jgi:hypothetical protein
VDGTDHRRPGGGDGVPAALDQRREAPALRRVAGGPHDEGEDHRQAAALRGAAEDTPERPQLRREQQAEREQSPRNAHDEHGDAWAAVPQQQRHAERAAERGDLEDR